MLLTCITNWVKVLTVGIALKSVQNKVYFFNSSETVKSDLMVWLGLEPRPYTFDANSLPTELPQRDNLLDAVYCTDEVL